MKKLKNKSGMTLMEMMVSILILVMLVVAMGTGMDSAMDIYEDAMFESSSASLANIVNTTLSDILRYCKVTPTGATAENQPQFLITNLDYGIVDAHFLPSSADSESVLRVQNSGNKIVTDLINTGASPNLEIQTFRIVYHAPAQGAASRTGAGYFEITYVINSKINPSKTREVTSVVRLLNTD